MDKDETVFENIQPDFSPYTSRTFKITLVLKLKIYVNISRKFDCKVIKKNLKRSYPPAPSEGDYLKC